MHIHVNVTLAAGDKFDNTPDEAAAKVLLALGGSQEKDYCTAVVTLPSAGGSAGTPEPPLDIVPPPETPPS